MRSSHEMVKMRFTNKLIAVIAILALALVPVLMFDGSDADVIREGQAKASGFTDNDSGTLTYVLKNTEATTVDVTLKVTEFGNADIVYTEKTVTMPAVTDNDGIQTVELSWKYGSDGLHYVDVTVYDKDGNKIDAASENAIEISVSHSIWKNVMTYIVIAIIVIVVIVVIVLYIRTTKKTKADTTMADKTFTKMHNEKVAKKSSATAEKREYKSSGDRTKRKK